MSGAFQISVDDHGSIKRAMHVLSDVPGKAKTAIWMAISSSTRATRAEVNRQLLTKYDIKRSELSSRMKVATVTPASQGSDALKGGLVIRSSRLPVMAFNTLPTAPPPQAGIPVAARQIVSVITVRGGKGMVGVPGRFVAKMASGHTNVMKRTAGSPSLPIDNVFMISPSEMVAGKRCRKAIEDKMGTVLQSELLRQVKRTLEGDKK